MSDRVKEKLVELLDDCVYENVLTDDPYDGFEVKCGNIADHLIAHGVTVQEWISVKDRLPEVVDTYIVAIKSKYDYEKDYDYDVDVATYNPHEKAYIDDCWNTYNDWDEGQQYLHITHWMPLPQPPKGE